MKIIGLSAKIGCGKSTIAGFIQELVSGSERVAFGDALKTEAAAFYGFPVELCYSETGKRSTIMLNNEKNPMGRDMATVRDILQFHGTDYRRKQDPRYWTKRTEETIGVLAMTGCKLVIVDDVRFIDEAECLRETGWGQLYRIDPYPGWKPGTNAHHLSEIALDNYDKWDCVFCPEYGLNELQAVAKCIVNAL